MQASKFLLCLGVSVVLAGCASQSGGQATSPSAVRGNPFANAQALSVAKAAGASKFRIVFSGNVNGEIEPCGCAVNPKGGVDRRWNHLQQLIAESKTQGFGTLVIDAGNALFPAEKLDKSQAKLQLAKARAVLKAHRLMGVAVQNVGYLDFAGGLEFLDKEALAESQFLISSNWVDASGKLLFAAEKTVEVAGAQILILGLSQGPKTPRDDGIKVLDPLKVLEQRVAQSPAGQPIVVLSDLGLAQDKEIAAKIARPLVFIGSRDLSSIEIPIHEGASILVQGQLQGQQNGVLEFAWNPKGTLGWYNTSVGLQFAETWDKRSAEQAELLKRPESAERKSELDILDHAFADMRRFVPANLDQKTVYDCKLVDLTVEYAKPNELSKLMDSVKKTKK